MDLAHDFFSTCNDSITSRINRRAVNRGQLRTRALMERLQADSKLRRLCGFDLRFALPSEATFSRAFAELAASELMQRVHARMIEDTLGKQLIGHISRDSTAIEARESIAKKDKAEVIPAKPENKRGRAQKGLRRRALQCTAQG